MRCHGAFFAGLIAAFGLALTAPAHASLEFTFSVPVSGTSSVDGPPATSISGTVTGEFTLPSDNTTEGASDFVITGYPAGMDWATAPFDVFADAFPIFNTFTVSDGVITSVDFYEIGTPTDNEAIDLTTGSATFYNIPGSAQVNSTAAPTFSSVSESQPAPEPASLALLLSGGLGLFFARGRARRTSFRNG